VVYTIAKKGAGFNVTIALIALALTVAESADIEEALEVK
jgi:hypothetical protein